MEQALHCNMLTKAHAKPGPPIFAPTYSIIQTQSCLCEGQDPTDTHIRVAVLTPVHITLPWLSDVRWSDRQICGDVFTADSKSEINLLHILDGQQQSPADMIPFQRPEYLYQILLPSADNGTR